MPRPQKCRWISSKPGISFFKPQGVPIQILETVDLNEDELEAIRLADLQNLNHENSAEKMNVSRATFGRIVAKGRSKIADALVNGKGIRIEGGEVTLRPPGQRIRWRKGRFNRGRQSWGNEPNSPIQYIE